MQTGTYISGGGHLALLAGLLLGGWFEGAPPEPPDVADISVISSEEFAALSQPETAPEASVEVPTPEAPEVEAAPAPPEVETPPVQVETPEAEPPADPDAVPEPPEPLVPEAEVTDAVPEITQPAPPILDQPDILPESDTPAPRDAPRVAPIPVPEAPVTPEIADTATPRVSPDANTELQAEDQPDAAPEEATTEIVTEAETPSRAPDASIRPPARPVRQAAVTETETAPAVNTDAVADALAEAVASTETTQPAPSLPVPTGPPLTRGEKDGLRVAVQQCWNVGSLSSDALKVTVTIAVAMNRDGKPDNGSIRMIGAQGGSDAAARQAFEAGRRAIIRCGARGFDLPVEKYDQWAEIEMTFNPEGMRLK